MINSDDVSEFLSTDPKYKSMQNKEIELFKIIKNKLDKDGIKYLLEYENIITEMQLVSVDVALNFDTKTTQNS